MFDLQWKCAKQGTLRCWRDPFLSAPNSCALSDALGINVRKTILSILVFILPVVTFLSNFKQEKWKLGYDILTAVQVGITSFHPFSNAKITRYQPTLNESSLIVNAPTHFNEAKPCARTFLIVNLEYDCKPIERFGDLSLIFLVSKSVHRISTIRLGPFQSVRWASIYVPCLAGAPRL